MESRRVLVTGGASGLGRAIVEHLAQAGYRVVGTYRSSGEAAAELEARFPGQIEMVSTNLARAEDRSRLVEQCREGGLHGLVNNLGIYPEEYIEDIDTELFEKVFHLTCTVGFDLVKRCLPLLEAANGARVINLGDSGADRIEARAQATPYHIAKLGVHVLTRTFAQRLGPKGVTVNMISPGFLENSVGEPGEPIPLGEPTRFEDILSALDFLLSDGARHVSGANLLVNGGWNLG
ncbi:MAG: SDR family oxidoreductase [Myxococcota bacterium]